ncbi:efflux RND transporter periplasmic adaptor subunit [Vulcanococcus limneticus]|uniref:efflux RND transporter periplasmic adaptor subunit n=1 Tax=Vulcanococcus limneticus TaxID=2170428 RepID=UPI00398BF256
MLPDLLRRTAPTSGSSPGSPPGSPPGPPLPGSPASPPQPAALGPLAARRRWLIAALLLTLGLGGTSLFVWRELQRRGRLAELVAQSALVVRRPVLLKVSAAGSIRPTTPVNISPKQPGRLSQLLVDQGDGVRAGQVLARMDDSNLRGPLLRAQGGVAAAQAALQQRLVGNRSQDIEQAQRNLQIAQADRLAVRTAYLSNRQLYGSGAIARVTYEASRAQDLAAEARVRGQQAQLNLQRTGSRPEEIAAARAQLLQAQGELATVRAQLEDTVIRAPFSGVVTQKYADVGAFVTPTTSASATSSATSSSILALASTLEAVASVAEVDVGAIREGQPVELQVDAFPRRVFRGRVRLVAPEAVVEQNVTSFQVRIALDPEARRLLRSGMNLTANVLVGQRPEALLIPTAAIVSQQGGTGVFVLTRQGRPRFRPVRVGATVGIETEALSGVAEGDRVLLTLPGRRRPNDRPVRANSPFSQNGGGRGTGGGRLPR